LRQNFFCPSPPVSGHGPSSSARRPKEVPMRCPLVLLGLSLCFLTSPPVWAQAQPTRVALRSNPALEQFKSLAGEWEGKDSRGKTVHLSYEVLASGVVMERLQSVGQAGMLTMYSLDGDHIVAIHFCSAGNQPVLKTGPLAAAAGKYDFTVERVYGLNKPGELHMVELLVTIADNDHFTQAWTNLAQGQRSTNTITYARKK
jgi:hypothetical protein